MKTDIMERFVTSAGKENKKKSEDGTLPNVSFLLNTTTDNIISIDSDSDNCSVSFSVKDTLHKIWINKD